MATIAFPSGPTVGQQYIYNGRTWVWDGFGWERLINQGQVTSAFVPVSPNVDVLLAEPDTIGVVWTQLTYV